MSDGRKYYCFCEANCRFETMTKEQILAAIAQAAETGLVFDADAAFITKVKEGNAGGYITFWVGTQAQYNAVAEKDPNCYYHITDSTKDADIAKAIAAAVEAHETRADNPHKVTAAQVGALPKTGGTLTGALTTTEVNVADDSWPMINLRNVAGKKLGMVSVDTSSNRLCFGQQETGASFYEGYLLPARTSGLTVSKFYTILTSKEATDYVVAQGTSGIWTYRKWNSGVAECWGNYDAGEPASGANVRTVTLPFNFTGNYIVNITPAKTGAHSHTHADCDNSAYAVNHSAGSFIFRYTYDYATLYSGSFNLHVLGKWK